MYLSWCIFRVVQFPWVIVSETCRLWIVKNVFSSVPVSRRLSFWMQLKKGSSPGGEREREERRLGRVLLSFENRYRLSVLSQPQRHIFPPFLLFGDPRYSPPAVLSSYRADSLCRLFGECNKKHASTRSIITRCGRKKKHSCTFDTPFRCCFVFPAGPGWNNNAVLQLQAPVMAR